MARTRAHYALPAPTGDPPADQITLWLNVCGECGGAGVIDVPVDVDAPPADTITCPRCNGSGSADLSPA